MSLDWGHWSGGLGSGVLQGVVTPCRSARKLGQRGPEASWRHCEAILPRISLEGQGPSACRTGSPEAVLAPWQVEIWFSKVERDVIARGVFTSVADLARKLRKYIRAYGKSAQPFRWSYTDASRRIRPVVTI